VIKGARGQDGPLIWGCGEKGGGEGTGVSVARQWRLPSSLSGGEGALREQSEERRKWHDTGLVAQQDGKLNVGDERMRR